MANFKMYASDRDRFAVYMTEDKEEIALYCDRINFIRQLRLDLESFIEANSIDRFFLMR
jgi:hypothetical protein